MAAEPPAPSGARCALHPQAPAVATCSRCGTFLCGACTELKGEAAWCGPCLEVLRQGAPPSRLVQGCIGLGVAGVLCFPLCLGGPFLTLLAAGLCLWLPTVELRRIARGERPARGRMQARVARGLGWANLALLVLWGGLLLYVLAFRGGR